MLAAGRLSIATRDRQRLTKRNDWATAAPLAGVVDRPVVVALVQRGRLHREAALAEPVDQRSVELIELFLIDLPEMKCLAASRAGAANELPPRATKRARVATTLE
jgi:hypothetical protein